MPTNYISYFNLGVLYLNTNRNIEAEAITIQTLKINQNCRDAYIILGCIYDRLGRIKLQKNALKK